MIIFEKIISGPNFKHIDSIVTQLLKKINKI